MRFARGDMRDHIVHTKRPRTLVVALQSLAAARMSKNQLSRDFAEQLDFRLLQHYLPKSDIDSITIRPLGWQGSYN